MLIAMSGVVVFVFICCCGGGASLTSLQITASPKSDQLVLDVKTADAKGLVHRLQTPQPVMPWSRGIAPPVSGALVPAAVAAAAKDVEAGSMPNPEAMPDDELLVTPHPTLPLLVSSLRANELPPGSSLDTPAPSSTELTGPEPGVEMALRRPMERTTQLETSELAFAGATGGADKPVFVDEAAGQSMCDELAAQLHNMNHQAASEGRPPYRLWVEGHVSAALYGAAHARRLSRERAQVCAGLIQKQLRAIDGYLNVAQAEALVVAIGMGHTRPLPGYDDGGNYTNNRRVEFHIQQLDTVDETTAAYTMEVFHRPAPMPKAVANV